MKKLNQSPPLPLLLSLISLPQLSETIYTPVLSQLANSFGVSLGRAEFSLSVYFIGFALGVFVWGLAADRIGRRMALLSGLVAYALGCIGCYLSKDYSSFLIMRGLQGFGGSAGSVVTQIVLRDLFQGTRRTQIFAVVGGVLSLSPALGPLLGAGVSQSYGWRSNFALLIAGGALLWIWSFRRLTETQPESLPTPTTQWMQRVLQLILQMSRDPRLWIYGALIGICNGILFSYYGEAPYLAEKYYNLSPWQYGLLGPIVAIPILIASQISRRLNQTSASVSSETRILWGCGGTLLGALLLRFLEGSFSPLLALFLLFLGIGLILPECLSHAIAPYQNQSGAAGSLFGLLYYVLIAGLTAMMSHFHDGSLQAMPNYFIQLSLMMILLSLGLIRTKK